MEDLSPMQQLEIYIQGMSGMSPEAFELSVPYWQLKTYKKGEFYNEYKNVCRHLGFVLSGIFRIYKYEELKQTEKNMLFFTSGQLMTSYRSFLNQVACEYFTESMTASEVLYIHHEQLQQLYKESHEWERFGRIYTERVLDGLLHHTETQLFLTPEERYTMLLQQHPDVASNVPLYHIASYLGIEGPSLSRIRKRMQQAAAK
ncbi:cAMP-binding domain of CRP or a regulatory subunit of cAMP-dependent protein kinases [Filimonas lacunae]|uniref:cAMP-binding domain of CRP or a regulatory subunit of cAMP-dependent protein kinases n=1 Tax=Filimonas lacunae TaxID=477680 RepID=A0A173MBG7_9BACT|nr:Crp/Fnr family transcriptional regulator [Filimonas lacunae]BAV04904.1 Crp/Fnr family transcriptional regulator [Filimonas lacunae]SIT33826.1 cAMP-binding domain of CRP or a regulatory subunit of cAMP-dependent protein kinases [Filimonas lacunae]